MRNKFVSRLVTSKEIRTAHKIFKKIEKICDKAK